ncbi:zinc finger protein [Crotalus adamanteus]|uniref:Zinc finger protein n=1 Tax=Crotalus adamanteus TaxID=8729 RepID=A0AAW1B655_CROAD
MLQLHLEDDIEDYLEGFESVAYTNRWPRADFQLGNEPPVPFKDIDVRFSSEEQALLTEEQRALYDDVMMENFQNVSTLGISLEKPEIITRIQQGGELYFQNNTINSPKDRFIGNQLSPTVIQGAEKHSFLKRATKTVKVQAIAMEVPQDNVSLGETPLKESSSNSIKEAATSVPPTSTLPLKKPLISPKKKSSKRKKYQSLTTEKLASTKDRPQPSLLQKTSKKQESGSQILTVKAGKQKKTLAPQGARPSQLKKPTASVGEHPKQKKKSEVLNKPPMLNKETQLCEKIVQEKDHQQAFLEVKVHEAPLPVTTWNPPFSATVVSDLTCPDCGRSFKQRWKEMERGLRFDPLYFLEKSRIAEYAQTALLQISLAPAEVWPQSALREAAAETQLEMQDWIRERSPETCDRAVALAEEYLQEQQETEKWAQQVTVPIEMVIVNSPTVDQAQSEAKHLHKENKQIDTENSISQEDNFARMGAKDMHQGELEAEERGWRSPEFGEVLFPKGSPRRSHISKCDSERSQKSSLSTRMMKDEVFGGVPADLEMKRHLCKECGKRFRKKWDLIRHERIHTGEKPHQCTYCGKRFTRRSHVVNHQRRHSCQGRS